MIDEEIHPSKAYWPEIPGMVQMVLATFVPDKGWLVTKRSFIYGGRHGPAPLLDDIDSAYEIMAPELKNGLKAMKHGLDNS